MRLIVAFIVAAVVSACGTGPASGAPPMVVAGNTVQITEHVYVIPDQRVALVPNVGIVVGTEGVLVVDTGMGPVNAEIVLDEVRKITDLPISYLVCTHFHPEHNFGAQSFPENTIIIYSSAQHRDLRNKGEAYREWFADMFGDEVAELLAPVEITHPDVTFEKKAEFNLGDLPVELHHFGYAAHTGGDTVVYLLEQKVIFSGGLTPNRFFPIFPDEDSSAAGWIASLEQLEKFAAVYVVPGHGEVGDPDLIATVKAYLVQLSDASLRLKSAGVSLAEAQAQLSPRFEREYDGWDDPNWINNAIEVIYAETDTKP